MNPEDFRVLARLVQLVIISGTFIGLAFSPIAKAVARRIMHGETREPGSELQDQRVDELSGEVAALRQHLDETLERLDFAERMLTQARERGVLGPAKEG